MSAMLRCVGLCRFMLSQVTLPHVASWYDMLCEVMQCHGALFFATLGYGTLFHGVMCYVMSCCVLLCYALFVVVCYAMFSCCSMLCYIVPCR